jgi:hypothetical protein
MVRLGMILLSGMWKQIFENLSTLSALKLCDSNVSGKAHVLVYYISLYGQI